MRTIFAFAVLIVLSSTAHAQNAVRCSLQQDSALCELGTTEYPSARIIHVVPEVNENTLARLKKWETFCKPTPYIDNFGVTRFSYQHKRCEFGATE